MTRLQITELIWAGIFLVLAFLLYINRHPVPLTSVTPPHDLSSLNHHQTLRLDNNQVLALVDSEKITGADINQIINIMKIINPGSTIPLEKAVEKAIEIKLLKIESAKYQIKITQKEIEKTYKTLIHDLLNSSPETLTNQEKSMLYYMIEINLLKSNLMNTKRISAQELDNWLQTESQSSRVKREPITPRIQRQSRR